MKKVLFISHKYPPSIGGMEKQSYELINGMTRYAKVIALVYDATKESKFMFFWRLRSKVQNVLDEHPDIEAIHLNDGLMAAFSLWLRRLTKIPLYITFHGLDLTFPLGVYQKFIVPKFKAYTGFIAVSHHTASILNEKGFDESKIQVINNGVDVRPKSIKDDEPSVMIQELEKKLKDKRILLAVGRPVKRKGFSWFVEQVLTELPEDVVLLIAGSFSQKKSWVDDLMNLSPRFIKKRLSLFLGYPADKAKLVSLSEQSGIKERLELLPRLTDRELALTYQMSDLFIMPNIKVKGDMEGFGLVALESIIQNLPVLASNIEGIKDAIVNNNNGFLIDSANSVVWKRAVIKLLSKPVTLNHLCRKHKAYTMKNFSWETMCRHYANYMKLTSNEVHINKAYKGYINQKRPA